MISKPDLGQIQLNPNTRKVIRGLMSNQIDQDLVREQEAVFSRAFAEKDLELVRDLYSPEVLYLSPTVRLFDKPQRIEGRDATLAFVALTIGQVENVAYEAVEIAIVPSGDAAFVRIHFDWDSGPSRLRSNYISLYRYDQKRICQQELYYDPSGRLEVLGG